MDQERCIHCIYSRHENDKDDPGLMTCRRNPPKSGGKGFAVFPIIRDTDWCGSFKRKEVENV